MNAHRRQKQCSIIFAVAKMTAIQIPLYTESYSIENEDRDEMRLSTFFCLLQTLRADYSLHGYSSTRAVKENL